MPYLRLAATGTLNLAEISECFKRRRHRVTGIVLVAPKVSHHQHNQQLRTEAPHKAGNNMQIPSFLSKCSSEKDEGRRREIQETSLLCALYQPRKKITAILFQIIVYKETMMCPGYPYYLYATFSFNHSLSQPHIQAIPTFVTMPPSPLAPNATFTANTFAETTGSPLDLAKGQRQQQQHTPSNFATITQTTSSTSSSPSPWSSLSYYSGMPVGLLGSGTPANSHAGVVVGVSCGILAVILIAIAYGLTRHIQRSVNNDKNCSTAKSIHDAFRLQPVGAQHHHRHRQRHRLQPQAQHQNLQLQRAQQRLQQRPEPTAATTFSQWTPRGIPAQPRESVDEQLDVTMEMVRCWKA